MIGHLLNSAVTVYRPGFTADDVGGRTKVFAEVGTIRVKVDQPSEAERMIAAQMGAVLTHVLHAPYGADVERADEIDTGGPRRLRVVAVVNNSRLTYTRIECQVIEGG
jgi:SPP1 family predicted phage head-tail adaptor